MTDHYIETDAWTVHAASEVPRTGGVAWRTEDGTVYLTTDPGVRLLNPVRPPLVLGSKIGFPEYLPTLLCGDEHVGFGCARILDHPGPHAAVEEGHLVCTWRSGRETDADFPRAPSLLDPVDALAALGRGRDTPPSWAVGGIIDETVMRAERIADALGEDRRYAARLTAEFDPEADAPGVSDRLAEAVRHLIRQASAKIDQKGQTA